MASGTCALNLVLTELACAQPQPYHLHLQKSRLTADALLYFKSLLILFKPQPSQIFDQTSAAILELR